MICSCGSRRQRIPAIAVSDCRRDFSSCFLSNGPLGEPESGVPDAERVTHKTRCSRKRPGFPGVLTLYSLAALRERILFIFPSE
jgi:hypothetical protein